MATGAQVGVELEEINYLKYFFEGFGIILGIVAGVVITMVSQWLTDRQKETRKLVNLKFEFELNIKKINVWLGEIIKWRNAVNGDSIATYSGYFDLSRFVTVTANDMFVSGLLYKYMGHAAIGDLQVISAELTFPGENMISEMISQQKANLANWASYKQKAVSEIDFWENRFKSHKQTLMDILSRLNKPSIHASRT